MRENKFFIGFLLFVGFTAAKAQAGFSSVEEILHQINSQPSDKALNTFIREKALVEPWFWKKRIARTGKDTLVFHTYQMKVDVFRKNLFGNEDDEVILQLREGSWRVISVFYREEGMLMKVPGQITNLNEWRLSYQDQKFVFYFEDIAAKGEFCILTKNSYSAEYGDYQWLEIFQVQPDTIRSVLRLQTSHQSSADALPNLSRKVLKSEFKSTGPYPKKLMGKQEELEYQGLMLDSGGDTLSGRRTREKQTIEWRFTVEEGKLYFHQSSRETQRHTKYFSRACRKEQD